MREKEIAEIIAAMWEKPRHIDNETVSSLRKLIKHAHETEEYLEYGNLENQWRSLEPTHSRKKAYNLSRENHIGRNALETMQRYLRAGMYPPPEVLAAINHSFTDYMDSQGDMSLDEAMFGKAYKKTTSFAYEGNDEIGSYDDFHKLWATPKSNRSNDLEGLSITARAELYLAHVEKYAVFEEDKIQIDLDSFVRSYHRWVKRKNSKEQS